MDRDLLEVTIPRLEAIYRSHKYTVTQVVEWYLARIAKYNGIYRAVQYLDTKGRLGDGCSRGCGSEVGRKRLSSQGRCGEFRL